MTAAEKSEFLGRSSRKVGGGVKLVDVAASAGVSLATASRALSNPALVRSVTLEKVRKAADLLGYVPHGAARALASHRTRTIGAVFPPVDNPIFATGTRSLAQALSEAGYTLLLATHDYNLAEELDAIRRLIERGVDGLVLVGLRHDDQVFDLMAKAGLPYELTWSIDPSEHHHSVGVEHHEAAAEITRHLLDLGHREFGVLAGLLDANDRARERLNGVRQALSDAGVALSESRIVQSEFGLAAGRTAMVKLLQQDPGFTAVVSGNDTLAIGAIQECAARRIDVPGEISVVGFDNIDMAGALSPGLTTMEVPSAAIGRAAATRLLSRLSDEPVVRCRECRPTSLCAAPRLGRLTDSRLDAPRSWAETNATR